DDCQALSVEGVDLGMTPFVAHLDATLSWQVRLFSVVCRAWPIRRQRIACAMAPGRARPCARAQRRGCGRVGRRRGPTFAGLFQRPPTEPGMPLSKHPALQCRSGRGAHPCELSRVDDGVAVVTDDQGLTMACSHLLAPGRDQFAAMSLEVLQM